MINLNQLIENPELAESITLQIKASDLIETIENSVKSAVEAMKPESKDALIPRREAMEILNVKTTATMLALERKGYLRPHRLVSRIFYQESEVRQAAEQFKREEP